MSEPEMVIFSKPFDLMTWLLPALQQGPCRPTLPPVDRTDHSKAKGPPHA
jgi:hypothetical protein